MAASARSPVSALVKSPVSPSRTTSSTPEARTATAGRPQACASARTSPCVSVSDAKMNRSAAGRTAAAPRGSCRRGSGSARPPGSPRRAARSARLVGALAPRAARRLPDTRRGDGAEGVDHALHALLAVEPAHVETDRVIRGQPEHRRRLTLVAGREEIERHAGRDDGDRRPDTPRRRAAWPAMCSDGRDHQVRGAREPAGEAHRQPRHRPLRQRHVVGVLLVARVVREDERPSEPPRQPPRRDAEQERVLGVDDVEGEPARDAGRAAARRAAAARTPDRSARERTGSGRRGADRPAAAGRARREDPDVDGRRPQAPAAASRRRS